MATSNNVVDLSGENDNPGTPAGVSAAPPANPADTFERSCDNPECSAPRLISQVPKRDTSEFITEPKVLDQPTLVNGFTTVFQIDGIGTRMEDLMNESIAAENTPGQSCNPKTVFRVVPNTHAHIVNYVVVDAAGETMRKIKANEPETMRKLLVSQRLSAEQMLKKLIGKALETPTRSTAAPVPAPIQSSTPIGKSPIEVSKRKLPTSITMKLVPGSESDKSVRPSTSAAAINASLSKKIQMRALEAKKSAIPSTSKAAAVNVSSNKQTLKTVSQPTAGLQTTPRPTTSGGRVIAASRPVVWQAVPPGTATKNTSTPIKSTSPRKTPTVSARNIQPMIISPTNTTSSLTTSPAHQEASTSLKETELVDVEKSLLATSIVVPLNHVDSQTLKQENTLKRKPDGTPPVPEAIKRLRPRSPTRIQNLTPLAGNLSKNKDTPPAPSTRKLPTLPKFQKVLIPPKVLPSTGKVLIPQKEVKIGDDNQVTLLDLPSNKADTLALESEKTLKQNPPSESDTPVRRKNKPLMGPASKMKALKSIADANANANANANAVQNDAPSECKPTPITDSVSMKIGETTITRTAPMKAPKETVEPAEIITKPCSVAITDIAKSNSNTDSDNDSKTKKSRASSRLSSDKELSNSTNKKGKSYEAMIDRYRGRWTIKKEDESTGRKLFMRSTRSTATPKVSVQKPEVSKATSDDISDSTLLTTPSAPSRVLRVVLPSTKNGIVNSPSTSPHPNLKISSVISGGTTLGTPMREVDSETAPVLINDNSSGPDIEQLQKELADLRRTVARLTQGKNL